MTEKPDFRLITNSSDLVVAEITSFIEAFVVFLIQKLESLYCPRNYSRGWNTIKGAVFEGLLFSLLFFMGFQSFKGRKAFVSRER
jgi:hypothetical protein